MNVLFDCALEWQLNYQHYETMCIPHSLLHVSF